MENIKRFTRETQSTFNNGQKSPYLTFTLGPGPLRKLNVRVWVADEGLLDNGATMNDGSDCDMIEFRANMSDSKAGRLYVTEWNIGAPIDDDRCDNMGVRAWFEILLVIAESWEVGVFLTDGLSSIHRMDVEVHYSTTQGTLRNIPSHPGNHEAETKSPTAFHEVASSYFTRGKFDENDGALVPRGYSPQWVYYLQEAANRLTERFERTESISDINHAIRIGHKAVGLTGEGHPARAARLNSLGISLCLRSQSRGSIEDLDDAIRLAQEVLDCFSNRPVHPGLLHNLGMRLGLRSQYTGSLEDIDHAIDLLSRAAEMPQSQSGRLDTLTCVGNWMGSRFLARGSESDLNRAIEISEMAVGGTSRHDPLRTRRLINLTTWLGTRFMHTGSTKDLNLALGLLREEADAYNCPSNFGRSMLLNNLGVWLSRSFQRSGSIQDLNQGIEAAEMAVRMAPPGHPKRADWMSNLGSWLSFRFQHTGQAEDLQRGIELLSTVVDMAPTNHDTRLLSAGNLGILLGLRFQRTKSEDDLNRSIEILSSVVEETPHDHPDRARRMNNLGNWLGERYSLSGSDKDLIQSISCFSDGSKAPNSAPSVRIRLAIYAAGLLADHSSGLASFAAAATLNAGRYVEAALKLLEVGRGVTAGLLLETRAEVTELKHGHPALAEEFEFIRDLLDSPSSETSSSAPGTPALSWGPRRELEARFHAVVDKIRNQPGFGNFLLPPTTEQPHAAASPGPIVVVNYTKYRSDAFIVTAQAIRTIPLDLSTLPDLGDEIRITESFKEGRPENLTRGSFVSMPETPSHNGLVPCDLQFAEEEIGLVDSILNPSVSRTVMAQPTRDEVLHSVETCTIFHFAGHGISDPQDPSSSCLLLSDWAEHPLTVKDLTELKLFTKSPWLAYLSACSTGESKAENLQDEALHLVSSGQLAGFPHVIGSLWKIDDECSADAARHVYETMQSGGWTNRTVALGVHHAARFLRRKTGQREWLATRGRYHADSIQSEETELVEDLHANQGRGEGSAEARGFGYAGRSGGDPSIWAAYIHVGP
ncbi:TPR domain-containing protein [Colletotrichum sojae]|uniref:TPR domain-containing protein n=1 Tax=Colletotrichum sojae TaxID=2175907 RepID=A0A8H6JHH9_9PEZI|nr:TPR domain-containing protein [Colletotrichum sojae]